MDDLFTNATLVYSGDQSARYVAGTLAERPIRTIGICGPSGSGKSTFAKELQRAIGSDSMILDVESYWQYNRAEMAARNLTGYDWETRDTPRFLRDLELLKAGNAIEKPLFDTVRECPSGKTAHVEAARIIILEDTLDFSALADLRVFIYAPDEVLISRRLARDAHKTGFASLSELETYLREKSIPAYKSHLLPAAPHSDFVLNTASGELYKNHPQVK